MASVTFTTRANLVAGNPENIGDVTDCLDKLLAGVNSVSDSQLASPTGGVWRTIHEATFIFINATTAGTYWFRADGTPTATFTNTPIPFIFIDASAYAVTGKTAQLRLNVSALSGVSLGQTPTFGLYPIASISSSGASVALTLSAVVSGSTIAVAPSTNAGSVGQSAGFAVPGSSTTGYILGASLPGTTAATGLFSGTIRLELSYT